MFNEGFSISLVAIDESSGGGNGSDSGGDGGGGGAGVGGECGSVIEYVVFD